MPLLERQTRNDLVNESVTDKVGALRSIPTQSHRIWSQNVNFKDGLQGKYSFQVRDGNCRG